MIKIAMQFFAMCYMLAAISFSLSVHAHFPDQENKTIPSLAPMLERVTPAVVNIATEGLIKRQNPLFADPLFRRFFRIPEQQMEQKTQSLGSGVIIDAKRGLVLTNNHVIANATQITVTLHDGRHLEAELIGTDPDTDVAVIKIPSKDLVPIKIADSDKLRVGDFVAAIGNPFGLAQSVSYGIVSALGRSGLGIEGYEDFIQTDAPINPGNSGGALVNLHGDLVGINTAIFSRSGGNIGIGFVIPINMAMQIMDQLLKSGIVKRGFLGVSVQDLTADLVEAFDLDRQQGAVISAVLDDSPAHKAGLMPGDVVTAINGKRIRNAGDVRNSIGLVSIGDSLAFKILRNGEELMLVASISEQTPGDEQPVSALISPQLKGVTVGDLEQNHPFYGRVNGIIVVSIERGSPAWQSGLRSGDLITSVNKQDVSSLQEFLKVIEKSERSALLLRILRGNAAAFVIIK